MTAEAKGAKTAYINTKHVAKHAVWLAKSEAEKKVFATKFPDGDGPYCQTTGPHKPGCC